MGRPRDTRIRDAVFAACERLYREHGQARIADVRAAVGVKYSYAGLLVKAWREQQQEQRGVVRECLCCDAMFVSTGKHHRLCDKCRQGGEYYQPYPVSSAIHHVGREL